MTIIKATSWADLNVLLFQDSWDGNLNRFRTKFAFRGMADKSHDLKTSLMRLGHNYQKLERHLLRNFQKYAYTDTAKSDIFLDWLAIAQHHGLPTRFNDWTFSPYVALHFLTVNTDEFNKDGVIWIIDYHKAHTYLPRSLSNMLNKEGCDIFTSRMLKDTITSFESFKLLQDENNYNDFVIFLEPPSIDSRILNQYALFSLMSRPTIQIDEWMQDKQDLYKKIIIPATLKKEIRDKLDQSNINERILFPGLDGLCAWLKRHYSTF